MGTNVTENRSFGDRINLIIEAKCKSVADCARLVDIPFSTLRGMILDSEPKASHIAKFVKVFGINPYWLLFGEGDMQADVSQPQQVEQPAAATEEKDEAQILSLTKQNAALIDQNGRLLTIIEKLTNK